MKKKLFILLLLMFVPFTLYGAESNDNVINDTSVEATPFDARPQLEAGTIFKAKVIKIIEEQDKIRNDGQLYQQQNVLLRGLDGDFRGQEMTFYGIGDIDVLSAIHVEVGDKVLVLASPEIDGTTHFYITEHLRTWPLFFLALFFVALVVLVGRSQGARSILALILSFVIIMTLVLPLILRGFNPIVVAVAGSVLILGINIYLTWGINLKAHLAMVSIVISLIVTGLLALFTVEITRLTGATGEDVMSLINVGEYTVDFKGLLLAGIILCTIGVLDDVIISQISSVQQIKIASHHLTTTQLFVRSLRIGVDHLSSMTNTLFLAYAGAALPLLLLFYVKQEPFLSISQILNNEMIATEIVRTLVASIGLTLSVPFSTLIAAKFLKVKVKE